MRRKAETVGTQPERTANTGCERLTSSKIYIYIYIYLYIKKKKKTLRFSPLPLCVSKTVPSQQAPTSDKQYRLMWAHHVSGEEEHRAAALLPSCRSSAAPLRDSIRLVQAEDDGTEMSSKKKRILHNNTFILVTTVTINSIPLTLSFRLYKWTLIRIHVGKRQQHESG